jgi:hypothetical protein
MKMNRLSTALILISSAAAIWFFFFYQETHAYLSLSQRSRATISSWEVNEKSGSTFLLYATYSYDYEGVRYESSTLFKQPVFLDLPSAQKAILGLQGKPWAAWLNPREPNCPTLQRYFPFQEGIKATLCILVTIYFVFLRFSSRRNTV